MPQTYFSLFYMTNPDIHSFIPIFSFDNNRALKFGGITETKASPYTPDSLLGLSWYSMSSALSAYLRLLQLATHS